MINVLSFEVRYRNGEREDWVTYAPRHNPLATTSYKVKHLIPPENIDRDSGGIKAKHMHAIWSVVGPAYEAWKKGQEIPEDGIPLQAWPGVNDAQVAELRKSSIRTVEDVAGITDGQIQKIHLPNMHGLRRQAQAFLEGQAGADQAKKIAEQEARMEVLNEQLEAMRAQLEKPKRGRPKKEEAA